jgi:hypothetical protein
MTGEQSEGISYSEMDGATTGVAVLLRSGFWR